MTASEIRFEKPVTPALILAPPEFGTVSTDATKCRPDSFSSRPVICEQASRPACRETSHQPTTKRCSVVNFEQPVRPPFATMSGAEGSYGNRSCRGGRERGGSNEAPPAGRWEGTMPTPSQSGEASRLYCQAAEDEATPEIGRGLASHALALTNLPRSPDRVNDWTSS
jgi:hypothetical protein